MKKIKSAIISTISVYQRLIFLLILSSFCSLLNATIIEINTEGTGDYPTIQAGIYEATPGDTILVHSGRYYENIDFIGKAITVASLYLTTEDETCIHNTIIDGNQNGSCAKFVSGEGNNSILNGFTIENGTGTEDYLYGDLVGGGIYVFNSSPTIEYCIIQNNEAHAGGGLCSACTWEEGYSAPYLKQCTIRYNHAFDWAGGISTLFQSTVYFDEDYLCNIYLNTASRCNDLGGSGIMDEPIIAYIDTFTVENVTNFFYDNSYANDQIYINHAKVIPINQDLYVSPSGDDNNSGTSEDEPLKTIARALINIASVSDHPNTIHIAEGTCSPSLTNEKFPLNWRSYISLDGMSKDNTILDADHLSSIFYTSLEIERNYSIRNLTFQNSANKSTISLNQPRNAILENLMLKNNNVDGCAALTISSISSTLTDSTNIYLSNIEIIDNVGRLGAAFGVIEDLTAENLLIKNNTPDYTSDTILGGGLLIGGHYQYPDRHNFKIINSEITYNVNAMWEWPNGASAIHIGKRTNVDIINCTIGNNVSEEGDGAAIVLDGYDVDVNIVNSILYGDDPQEILLEDPYYEDEPITVNITNSLIMGGEEDIEYGSTNVVNWLDGNLDEDPLFIGTGDYPFALSEFSPCIDAGTLELPEGITLPEFDLAGNSRIYGDTIDMGAYEWNPVSAEEEDIHNSSFTIHNLRNYPNPFNPSTTISFTLAEDASHADVKVYNIKGQHVKTLMDAQVSPGEFNIIWQGTDNSNKRVASGTYFVKLNVNGVEKSVKKITVVK
jgi:hypothetical protein